MSSRLLNLSSEYTTLEIANRIEAAIHIWRQKYSKGHLKNVKPVRSSWGGKVKGLVADTGRSKFLAERAEILLKNLKLRFPGLPQTTLDMNKIQYNKGVGQSILECYSRVMESMAFNIMASIDDLLHVDDATKQRVASESLSMLDPRGFNGVLPVQKRISPSPFSIKLGSYDSPVTAPILTSSKQKPKSPMTAYSSVNKSSLFGLPERGYRKANFLGEWSQLCKLGHQNNDCNNAT